MILTTLALVVNSRISYINRDRREAVCEFEQNGSGRRRIWKMSFVKELCEVLLMEMEKSKIEVPFVHGNNVIKGYELQRCYC